ncbi:hypothetical protein Micbo1qcDRAFT_229632 [Microdochium bolleyi]|uniref:Uncharacterized protein n=1 Tax=Microdochium bolleyi TaxID=196109 RepID=A0A136JI56_9PEZI|nr:hypothetical protein Micbo1qcDRAFT_229632 [Microdochium bolleyi]
MSGTFPSEAVGAATGVLIYSFLSLTCCCLTLWLVWVHAERTSYVGLLSAASLLGTVASIIQQCHSIGWWAEVKWEQHRYALANVGSPSLIVAGANTGLDLGLFYVQAYSYNVCALLALSWAATLAQSVYGMSDADRFVKMMRRSTIATKIFAWLFPIFVMSIGAVPAIQQSTVAFIIVADSCMFIGIGLTSILMVCILGKYIHTRRKLVSWNPYARNVTTNGAASIYDRWLLVRFTIAFLVLSAYEVVTILFQIRFFLGTKDAAAIGAEPDLSASNAIASSVIYLPGVTSGFLVFVVFGTTKPFRQTMYETFTPKKFQKIEEKPMPGTYGSRQGTLHSSRTGGGNSSSMYYNKSSDCGVNGTPGDSVEDVELSDVVAAEHDTHHHYRPRIRQ